MDWPTRAADIADALYVRNRSLTTGTHEQQELFVRLVAEQCAFELGPLYGNKSAGPGRPQGPSQIAYNDPAGLGGWRIVDNDGSVTGVPGHPMPHPPWQAFPGQLFLPVVPADHLKTVGPAPLPDPPPSSTPPSADLMAVVARMAAIESQLGAIAGDLTDLLRQVDTLKRRGYPVYTNGWLTLHADVPTPK